MSAPKIKTELVKYVLEAEAKDLHQDYEHQAMYPDWAPADATEEDKAYARGRADGLNEAIGRLHKLAGLLHG